MRVIYPRGHNTIELVLTSIEDNRHTLLKKMTFVIKLTFLDRSKTLTNKQFSLMTTLLSDRKDPYENMK